MQSDSDSSFSDDSPVYNGMITPTFLGEPDPLPSKQGWLDKKTTGFIPRWTRRFFVLDSQELKYFYSDDKKQFGGVVNFDIVTVEVEVKHNVFSLSAIGGQRDFILRCKSEQEALDWVYAISLHINASKGRNIIFTVAGKKKFWKFNRISDKEFQTVACTGDLLLFRGKDIVSKIQRVVTKSDYDHVAFILKYSSGRIALFEATGTEGVSIVYWEDFLFYQWQHLYSRVVYRKLEFNRNYSVLQDLERFIKNVVGKRYKISPGRLLSQQPDKDPINKAGFFCSELVAAAYKELGILSNALPSSRYWPGDFAESNPIALLNNAVLHPGILLDFDIK